MIMKKILIVLCLFVFVVGCNSEEEINVYKNMTMEQAKTELDKDKSIILIDVRTLEEYNTGHITGSLSIPVETIMINNNKLPSDKNAKIFIYCQSGNRSKKASEKMVNLGYENVYNIGGIIDWKYETE